MAGELIQADYFSSLAIRKARQTPSDIFPNNLYTVFIKNNLIRVDSENINEGFACILMDVLVTLSFQRV